MPVDILGIGKSALLSFQRSLATTGHNIANVNTEGYSRQQVILGTTNPFYEYRGWFGTGVTTTEVRRVYDDFVSKQVTQNTSSYFHQSALSEMAATLDMLASNEGTSLNTALQNFFNSVQEVATSPTSIAARDVMLQESRSLVERFDLLNGEFERLQKQNNSQIRMAVNDINMLSSAIAEANEDIAIAWANGDPPNDLLDRRDKLINDLAEHVGIQTLPQDDGSINVFIGQGQALVVGDKAATLEATPMNEDPEMLDVALVTPGANIEITRYITGGDLGGNLEFRDQVLTPARNEIGRVALGLAELFNNQHMQGLDLDGALGQQYFAMPTVSVLDHPDNSTFNVSSITVQYEDISQVGTDDLQVTFDGANWTMTNVRTGAVIPMTPSGADFVAEGLRITPDPGAAAGDTYLVRPTRQASRQIDLLIDNPRNVAAAATHATEIDFNNTGTGGISDITIIDSADPNFFNDLDIVFGDPPTTFSINGGAAQAYTPGAPITLNGLSFVIDGTPDAGDTFRVTNNLAAVGDGENALKLAGIQRLQYLENSTLTVFGGYDQYVANVATRAREANFNTESQRVLLDQSVARHQAVSGVNLDEEAANLQRFQQSYQAAAQIIATADLMFNELLAATRR